MEEETEWLRASALATIRSLDVLVKVKDKFTLEGFNFAVTSLGNNQVLISGNSMEEIKKFRITEKALLDQWFLEINIWFPQKRRCGNLVWIRIAGMPLHGWSERGFRTVGMRFGEVLAVDGDTRSKAWLSCGRVLVYTEKEECISKSLIMKIGEERHTLLITEESWKLDPKWCG